MRVGWNRRYISHRLLCKRWLRNSSKIASVALLTAVLPLAFPEPSPSVFSANRPQQAIQEARFRATVMSVSSAVRSMDAFLERHEVREADRSRLAESLVATAKKYDLDAKLIASVMIVESRGNPFAISAKDSIGIMQIHLPTWGHTADREGINLLKIEDNIDFGARILKNYIRQSGLWEGVKRYNGFIANDPASDQGAQEYVAKVQQVYEYRQPAVSQAPLQ